MANLSGSATAEPLIAAVRACNHEVVSQLVSSVNANSTDKDGVPLLNIATETGDAELVKLILVRGGSPDSVDVAGRTCIHVAAAEGEWQSIQMVCTIEGDLDLEAKTKSGNTPLHRAAAYGHAKTIETLIKLGASHAAVNNDGLTPLMRAARWGHADAVTALLRGGASFSTQDYSGKTALTWARQKRFTDVESVLLNPPVPTPAESDDDEAASPGAGGGTQGEIDFFERESSADSEDVSIVAGASGHKFGEPMRVEGWMRKKGGAFGAWRNRFFVLEGRTVWYYAAENQERSKAKGVIRMVQGSEVLVEDTYTKPHCFNINTPSRKYVVQAANDEEMIEWMEALQNNVDVCPPEMALEEWDDVGS